MARPDQVVHARVHDDEVLAAGVLAVEHRGEQHAGAPDQVAARLEHQREPVSRDQRHDRGGQRRRTERPLVAVADAEAAADVERARAMSTPASRSLRHQVEQAADAFRVRLGVQQLAADVHRDGVEREQRVLPAIASASGTTWSTGTPNLIPPWPVAM